MSVIFEEQAIYFKNSKYFGFDAAVHLEDSDDEFFWNTIIQTIRPGKYNFIFYSKSKNGIDTKGCDQCLSFLPYLDKDFFVCLDSDLRFLLNDVNICKENFIAQSYMYSWESHFCISHNIHQRFLQKLSNPDINFDFIWFLKMYSQIVYKPLLFLLYLKRNNLLGDFEKNFIICLPKQCPRVKISNNGVGFIEDIENNMRSLCESHPLWSSFDVDKEMINFNMSFLTPENAYLFVRGHNIHDLIRYIGEKFICKKTSVSFYDEIMLKSFDSGSSYPELDEIKKDLEYILL